ncbi:TonB-dependent receptor plug domain-containing protein [Neptunicella sp. SCSIO 80796]|uniref:TonB-dependent receptor plug domain-containing protein n=1 Tax=Neptunicella plasticusilytica TaxID=3117012 RepID=UPI003A4D6E2F
MLNFKQRSAGVLSVILSTSCFAQAQAEVEQISILGSRIAIQKNKLSGSTTLIDYAQIKQSGALSLVDLLRGQNGLAFSQSGGKGALTELRMRGSEANHVLVLVDGVAINDIGQGDTVDFSQINLSDVQKIEILRGPQSALWGSGAVGGVILISTKAETSDLDGDIGLQLGQNNTRQLSAGVRGKQDKFNYGLSASLFKTDGSNISLVGNEDDGYKNTHFSNHLGWQFSANNRLEWSFQHSDATSDFDGTDFVTTGLSADANNHTDVLRQSGQLLWRNDGGKPWSHQAGVQFNRNENDTFNDNIANGSNHSDMQRYYWQSAYRYAPQSSFVIAAEHTEENFEQRGTVTDYGDPNQDLSNHINSLIVDVQHYLSAKWNLSVSARADHNQVFDNSNSHRMGVNYQPTDNSRLYVSYGKAVKNPSFVDRFGYYATSSFPFVGNPDLSPEYSQSWELGGDMQINQDWQWAWSWFSSRLQDEINGYYYDADNFVTTAINKDGTSHRQGVETSVTGKLGDLGIQINYSYLDASEPNDMQQDQNELRRPRHSAGITLNLPFASQQGNICLHAAYQGSREDVYYPPYPLTQQTVGLRAYTLVNLAIQYQLSEQLQLQLRADNLLDQDYQDVYGFAGQDRAAYVGATYRF